MIPVRSMPALRLALVLPLLGSLATAPAAHSESPAKVLAPKGAVADLDGLELWVDYGSIALYRTTGATAARAATRPGVRTGAELDRLHFAAATIEAGRPLPSWPTGFGAQEAAPRALHLVQFVGPLRDEWLTDLEARGVEPIHPIATHGFLVFTDAAGRASLGDAVREGARLQLETPLAPWLKVGPALRSRLEPRKTGASEATVPVVIQMLRHGDGAATSELIDELAVEALAPWQPILRFRNRIVRLRVSDVARIAARPDVTWIEERLPRELFDEVQGQILANDLVVDQSEPDGPGYLSFLQTLGFSTDPADYPIVDVVDDGIGTGSVTSGDPTLHEGGNAANPTRLAYVQNCTNAANGGGVGGHGHINASIAGGYDTRSGFPFQDPDGYQRGLGINPWTRLAGTRIFDPGGFDLSSCDGTDAGLIRASQDAGAGISSNSWGCSGCAGTYDDSSQAFDAGTRDADQTEALSQELLFVFAAGNSGPGGGTVGTPGNGKNILTVGASENHRPSDEDGNWSDGCLIGPSGADDAMDVISFSSRGPSPGGRVKPDVIAPGTHIQGTASTHPSYSGGSVCDEFRPSGQTTFAASSGTSHSTPAVSGVASLAWWWIENDLAGVRAAPEHPVRGAGAPPSPALSKAYLMAHPTYLTGVAANDTLPSNSQGYGMPNLELMFGEHQRYLLDQTEVLDTTGAEWTWTGAVADETQPVRIVLVWTDAPGAIGTSPQVNDLDLEASIDGTDYLGNVFSGQWSTSGGSPDSANNAEAVFLPAGTGGAIELTVRAANIAGDGVPDVGDATDQDFALVCFNCIQEPIFTLSAGPPEVAICAPADAEYQIDVGQVLGFSDPVDLAVTGNPAGTTTVFSDDQVTPPDSVTLTIGNTGAAAPGASILEVTGTSGLIERTRNLDLEIFDVVPGAPPLTAPADEAVDQPFDVALSWAAQAQDATYEVEVASDEAFDLVVASTTGLENPAWSPPGLQTSSVYWWRVRVDNACGTGPWSAVRSFSTEAAPGDCSLSEKTLLLFADDLEGATGGWSHSGTQDTWQISTARSHSGASSFHAQDVSSVSDQRLVSPAIALPAAPSFTLQFWNWQEIEDSGSGCFDGALLEISTDDGANWSPLDSELETDPYDGLIDDGFSNPLADRNAWCGDPQDWLESIVDLAAYAGETVRFRFRLGTDSSIGREGWYVDDVVVQGCLVPEIFADGFESGDTSSW